MIQFDESEYGNYALSGRSMRQVALLLGPECATKLIYNGDRYVSLDRLAAARSGTIHQTRTNDYDDTGPCDIWYPSNDQEPEDTAKDAEVRSLADTG